MVHTSHCMQKEVAELEKIIEILVIILVHPLMMIKTL